MGIKDETKNFMEISDSCEIVKHSSLNNSTHNKVHLMSQSSDENERKNGSFVISDSTFENPYSIRIGIELKQQHDGYKCLDLRIRKRNLFDIISFYDHTGVQRLKGHRIASFMS